MLTRVVLPENITYIGIFLGKTFPDDDPDPILSDIKFVSKKYAFYHNSSDEIMSNAMSYSLFHAPSLVTANQEYSAVEHTLVCCTLICSSAHSVISRRIYTILIMDVYIK